jgi:hypothetical protein
LSEDFGLLAKVGDSVGGLVDDAVGIVTSADGKYVLVSATFSLLFSLKWKFIGSMSSKEFIENGVYEDTLHVGMGAPLTKVRVAWEWGFQCNPIFTF